MIIIINVLVLFIFFTKIHVKFKFVNLNFLNRIFTSCTCWKRKSSHFKNVYDDDVMQK